MQLSLIMKTFLNFLWNFPFLGFIYAIITGISGLLWCLTIIGLPLGLGLLQFSLFLFWPHGYAMVSKGDLEILTEKKRPLWWKIFALIIRIIYFPFGLVHAMFMACVGLIEFFTIIGIPQGLVTMKSISTYFNPVNKVRVPQAVADQIAEIKRGRDINRYAPQKNSSSQPATTPSSAQQQSLPQQAPSVTTAAFCHNCGNPLTEGPRFCPKCGTMVASVSLPATSGAETAETATPQVGRAPAPADTDAITAESRDLLQPESDDSPAGITPADTPDTLTDGTSDPDDKKKQYFLIGGAAIVAVILICIICIFAGNSSASSSDDDDMYTVLADNLFFRSSPSAITDRNLIAKIPYGTHMKLVSREGDWAEVEVEGEHGYVGWKYILPDSTFRLHNNVWDTVNIRDIVNQNRCRLAVLDYITRHSLPVGMTQWQINYGNEQGTMPNNVMWPDLKNMHDKYPEFAFIIENGLTHERRMAIYSFDSDTEEPILIHDSTVEYDGMIKDIRLDRNGNIQISFTGRKYDAIPATVDNNPYDYDPGCATLDEILQEEAARMSDNVPDQNLLAESPATAEEPQNNLPVTSDADHDKIAATPAPGPDGIYESSEIHPKFPGGEAALMKWINQNIRYPTMAIENNVQGRVVVKFVVDNTGKVGRAIVIRGKDPDLDKEALRVVKSLPAFTPGMINNQPVSVWYTIPIQFRLS